MSWWVKQAKDKAFPRIQLTCVFEARGSEEILICEEEEVLFSL